MDPGSLLAVKIKTASTCVYYPLPTFQQSLSWDMRLPPSLEGAIGTGWSQH